MKISVKHEHNQKIIYHNNIQKRIYSTYFYESLFQKPYNYIYCPDILDQMRQVSKFLSRQRSTFRPWVWHHTRAGRENGKNPRLALFTQHLSPMVRWHGRHVAAWLCTMSLLAEIRTGPACDPEIRAFEMNLNWSF